MNFFSEPQKFFSPIFMLLRSGLRQHKTTLHNLRPRNTTAKLAANRQVLTLGTTWTLVRPDEVG